MFARRRPAIQKRVSRVCRRAQARKRSVLQPRPLRGELLESRLVLSSLSALANLRAGLSGRGVAAIISRPTLSLAPTIAKPASLTAPGKVTGNSVGLSVLGSDPHGESSLKYTWRVTAAPQGGSASFSVNANNAAKNDKITFTKAGAYGVSVTIVNAGGLSVTSSLQITVASTFAGIGVYPSGAKAALGANTLQVTGSTTGLSATALDQFGAALAAQPSFTWATTSAPSGAAPKLAGGNGAITLSFNKAGAYAETITAALNGIKISTAASINVVQALSRIAVTPGTASLQAGGTQQFRAQAFDQFQSALTSQPAFTWTASGGSIGANGLFAAQNSTASGTITAKSGAISGAATVTVTAPAPTPSPGPGPMLQDAAIARLVANLDADGSLGRSDMMQIFTSVGNDGSVSAGDLADLKTLVANAAYYNMPDYVRVLAADVVVGNPANATYQGVQLGNLAAGSSSTQLNKLVAKWFLGADHPALNDGSLTYTTASGPLFAATPSHNDEYQGQLGDCYLISALGTIADQNPRAIRDMFTDNGDGTYTVRFYTGNYGAVYSANGSISDGFLGGVGTADYVTVDRALATFADSDRIMAYANYGQSAYDATASLWIPLAEKAYAQWNQTGKEGRDGKNAYASIEYGWMARVDAQVLGRNASDYVVNNATKQAMITALAANQSVTIGTNGGALPYGLYGSHAYAVIGYNASADLFTLYNPWGMDQPGVLSWPQLQATCGSFVVANASAAAPSAGGNVRAGLMGMKWTGPSAAGVDAALASGDCVTSRLPGFRLR
jgi:PKD repeat protein